MTKKADLKKQETSEEQYYINTDIAANIHHRTGKGRLVILKQDLEITQEDPNVAVRLRTIRDIISRAIVRKTLKRKSMKEREY